jgi:hypothetical protein
MFEFWEAMAAIWQRLPLLATAWTLVSMSQP